MAKLTNQNQQSSSVDNSGATFQNAGHVYNGPVNRQTIVHEKAVTYDVDHRDVDLLERWSMFIVGKLGESKTKLSALSSVVLGIAVILSSTYRYPAFVEQLGPAPTYMAVLLVASGGVLWMALQYRYESRCAKCNTFYAMKEVGDPKEREVPVKGGVQVTTTRTYECSKCNHSMTKKTNRFIEDEPSD